MAGIVLESIRFKRVYNESSLPKKALFGEPIYCKSNNSLYIGQGTDMPLKRLAGEINMDELPCKIEYTAKHKISFSNINDFTAIKENGKVKIIAEFNGTIELLTPYRVILRDVPQVCEAIDEGGVVKINAIMSNDSVVITSGHDILMNPNPLKTNITLFMDDVNLNEKFFFILFELDDMVYHKLDNKFIDTDTIATREFADNKFQTKTDVTLTTKSKNIPGAINEIDEKKIEAVRDSLNLPGTVDNEYPNLNTKSKKLIGAINEIDAQFNTIEQGIGTETLPTTSQTLKGAIAETFQSVSNGKQLIATAITDKGVSTSSDATFQTMANNIGKIQTNTVAGGNQNTLNKCGVNKFKFAIFSDVHIFANDTANSNIKFTEALNFINTQNCDFIAVCGDLANYDVPNELVKYKTLASISTIPIYEVAGNHDATNAGLDTALWLENTGQTPYYEVIHENEVFLFVSQANWSDNVNASLFPIEYQEWLTSKLEAYKTKSRVFLFFHQYMPNQNGFGDKYGTIAHSYLTQGSLPYFADIISKYKNVIWFSGHSHTLFSYQTTYPNVIAYNGNGEVCTMIHTPTLQDGELYICTVYDHLVELEGYKNGAVVDTIYYAIDDYTYISPVESITLNTNVLNFANTSTQALIATVTPSNQQSLLSWESSNINIATVTNGVVTPIGNGSCNIIAKCGDKSAICSVIIDIPETDLYYSITGTLNGCTLSNTATNIRENENYVSVITESVNTSIDSVTVKMGGIDISDTAYNPTSKTIGINMVNGNIEIIVSVNYLCTGINITDSSITLTSTNATKQLTVNKIPLNAIGEVTWSTSNNAIATVVNGLVTITATSSGTCTITATCNGYSDTCTINVSILTKTIIYEKDSVTGIFNTNDMIDINTGQAGGTFRTDLLQSMNQGVKYYMTCDSLKLENGTDINMTTDKIYIKGTSYKSDGTMYKQKVSQDYDNIVGVECVMTDGFNEDLCADGSISYFAGLYIRYSSTSPLVRPITITMQGFKIFTYGETII